jgi:N-acetylmuramic acid 6-phosphate (MurNAc-6-P) etherase
VRFETVVRPPRYCHSFAIADGKAQEVPVAINNVFRVITEKLKTASPEERRAMQGGKVSGGTSGSLGVFDAKCVPCALTAELSLLVRPLHAHCDVVGRCDR